MDARKACRRQEKRCAAPALGLSRESCFEFVEPVCSCNCQTVLAGTASTPSNSCNCQRHRMPPTRAPLGRGCTQPGRGLRVSLRLQCGAEVSSSCKSGPAGADTAAASGSVTKHAAPLLRLKQCHCTSTVGSIPPRRTMRSAGTHDWQHCYAHLRRPASAKTPNAHHAGVQSSACPRGGGTRQARALQAPQRRRNAATLLSWRLLTQGV